MIAEERETVLAFTDADDRVMIYTCRRPDIRALRRRAGVTEVDSGTYPDGTPWARFTVPVDRFALASAVKRPASERQRAALAAARQKSSVLHGDFEAMRLGSTSGQGSPVNVSEIAVAHTAAEGVAA